MKNRENKKRIVALRLTLAEFEDLSKAQQATTCRKISQYLRSVIFNKPVIKAVRNKSMDDFLAEMMKLKSELNSIGVNLNQVVRKLNTYQAFETVSDIISKYERDRQELQLHLEKITAFIEKNALSW